ncbi:MAG: hypothetical protein U5J95_01930 [Balneolaceae bacterium]|nr:hypothetical protein [Balneolaceae bacterium]
MGIIQLSLTIESLLSEELTIYAATVVEWGHIVTLAILLGALASFIRDSKPYFAQFPKAYIGLPLLIVISYVLVKDTYAIKEWLISIYQGGALLVALLMYGVYTYRSQDYALVITGILVFLITYLVFWFVPINSNSLNVIWKLLLGLGIIITVLGYDRLDISKSGLKSPAK